MNNTVRSFTIAGILVFAMGVLTYFLIYLIFLSVNIRFTGDNVSNIKIFYKNGNKLAKSTTPNNTVRLKKETYQIVYEGASGYSGGTQELIADKAKTVAIDPDYSDSRLSEMLTNERSPLVKSISNSYPAVDQYILQPGKLYKKGEWYGTTLVYNGSDDYNADMLRIVLKKVGENWQVVSRPPSIFLTNDLAPGVPDEVLKDINASPVIIQDKFGGNVLRQE